MPNADERRILYEAVEQEAARREYPAGFPALPEIPGGRYFEQDFFDLEMEHVWKKTWISAGHASELPEQGSFMLFEKLGLSIIVTRDKTDLIRAYHNVCRHRGAPLVLKATGKSKRFTCPYHSWSYNLAGELVAVPEEFNFACLDREKRGLIPVRCETWRGFIFLNLDNDAGSLIDFLGAVVGETADFPLEHLRVHRSFQLTMECNWKAMYDNFLESYHVSSLHPKSLFPYLDSTRMLVDIFRNGHSRMKTKKKVIDRITHDGDDRAPMLDDDTGQFAEFTTGTPIFPNVQLGLEATGFPIITCWPDGPRRAILDFKLMGVKGDTSQDTDYWDQLLASNIAIIDEDLALLNKIQHSLEGGFFTGMMLSYTERSIYWYHEEIDRRIGIDRIPSPLRIQQVLEDHVGN